MKRLRIFSLITVLFFTAFILTPRVYADTTFIVNRTGNGSDASPGDGVCATGIGVCTLRAAIEEANAWPGTDTIYFDLGAGGVQTIRPTSPLPPITETLIINGTTQPGYAGTPLIRLRGDQAGANSTGLVIEASATDSIIRGLSIVEFRGNPIAGDDRRAIVIHANNVQLEGNYIGVNPNGTSVAGNTYGISITGANATIGGNSGVTIGRQCELPCNLISGNEFFGIFVEGSGSVIQGNLIGTDGTGVTAIPNGVGIALSLNSGTVIGGSSTLGEGNVISGNDIVGIQAERGSNLDIMGNHIGLDASGLNAVGNNNAGIVILGGENIRIGVPISGGEDRGNLIAASEFGIALNSAENVSISRNIIGTDISLTQNFGHTNAAGEGSGISVEYARDVTIGGWERDAGNIIVNSDMGIELVRSQTIVKGNFIGWHPDTGPMGNQTGIYIYGTPEGLTNLIGGYESLPPLTGEWCNGACNFIAYNEIGIRVWANNPTDTDFARNSFLANSFFKNTTAGIYLEPSVYDPTDPLDADGGPNMGQNYPELTSAVVDPSIGVYIVRGKFNSTPNTTFSVDIYGGRDDETCPSSYPQGKYYKGTRMVTTDASGDASFFFVGSWPLGTWYPRSLTYTAVLTDPEGNTSEFGPCIEADVDEARTMLGLIMSDIDLMVANQSLSADHAKILMSRINAADMDLVKGDKVAAVEELEMFKADVMMLVEQDAVDQKNAQELLNKAAELISYLENDN